MSEEKKVWFNAPRIIKIVIWTTIILIIIGVTVVIWPRTSEEQSVSQKKPPQFQLDENQEVDIPVSVTPGTTLEFYSNKSWLNIAGGTAEKVCKKKKGTFLGENFCGYKMPAGVSFLNAGRGKGNVRVKALENDTVFQLRI